MRHQQTSPRSAPLMKQTTKCKYPVPAYLDFAPGGVEYKQGGGTGWKDLNSSSPKDLASKAHAADSVLRLFSLSHSQPIDTPQQLPSYFLPSLSILAEAAFGSLTGVPAAKTRLWANALLIPYLQSNQTLELEAAKGILDEPAILKDWSLWAATHLHKDNAPDEDIVSVLKNLYKDHVGDKDRMRKRPCGYLFRKGDIAWNCRTCQYDPTCVLCDPCFRASNHSGHEVYFHRTNAGGCCDCGDLEAFRLEGCCPRHAPDLHQSKETHAFYCQETTDPDYEAVHTCRKSRHESHEFIRATLPPKLAAALGVVVGAAIHTIVRAIEGSGMGADPIVWTRRWADQLYRICHGHAWDEEYSMDSKPNNPTEMFSSNDLIGWSMKNIPFPDGFSLHLRIHNDDVHTYEEVTDALYDRNSTHSNHANDNPSILEEYIDGPLIDREQDAHDFTSSVDTDGQAIVRQFSTLTSALRGFQRLKRTGLHCAVLSTPQLDLEERARVLMAWLNDVSSSHPAAAALVVQGLVDVTEGKDSLGQVHVWATAHMIPPWSCRGENIVSMDTSTPNWRKRLYSFPPNKQSSYLSRDECFRLHFLHFFSHLQPSSDDPPSSHSHNVCDKFFYANIPYSLASERFHKSPHSLWGTFSLSFSGNDNDHVTQLHPFLRKTNMHEDDAYHLLEELYVVDTDSRKECDASSILRTSLSHEVDGLYMISGVGLGSVGTCDIINAKTADAPSAQILQHLLSIASFRAPISPLLLLVLFDPYSTKQTRSSSHSFLLSLLTDPRFKTRLAIAFGGVAYRPLTTLYSSGIGTDGDSILYFNVQVFTAGSLVRALGNVNASRALLCSDNPYDMSSSMNSFTSTLPISYCIALAIQHGLLGSSKDARRRESSTWSPIGSSSSIMSYRNDEHPITTLLPALSDDSYLDERSIQHKRLQKLLRDMKHIIETPGTALRLLLSSHLDLSPLLGSVIPVPFRRDEPIRYRPIIRYPQLWCRILRLVQGIDIQKRKISGGHVEYEKTRWREALSLSLHFLDACDALADCPFIKYPPIVQPSISEMRQSLGQLLSDILCEIKKWLYRDDVLEASASPPLEASGMAQMEVLQRSTLHVSKSIQGYQMNGDDNPQNALALSCATQIKLTEAHLTLIDEALRAELSSRSSYGAVLGDCLRVPHSLLEGDALSFHIPLHRLFSKCILSITAKVVQDEEKSANPQFWWRVPVVDTCAADRLNEHPLCSILSPSLDPDNCKVIWSSSGNENLSDEEMEIRRSKIHNVSASIASSKVIHSLCDHPLRCIVAAEQISRHLWVRNGHSAAYTAMHYMLSSNRHSFRVLDFTSVQFSASGYSIGLGAKRVFALLVSRFSLDGYLCDPERRPGYKLSKSGFPYGGNNIWVNPPRLQDPEHAAILAESFFTSLCILVTELPPPPPISIEDFSSIQHTIRRELVHVLAAEPRTHSEALSAVSVGMRDDEDGQSGPNIRLMFTEILRDVSRQKITNRSTNTPTYELKSDCSEEYDPTFMHLRRSEHQHALDNVARLRKQLQDSDGKKAFPVVPSPRISHPRLSPCRLILHLSSLDAAIRRFLLFALTGGQWLPPDASSDAVENSEVSSLSLSSNNSDDNSSSNERFIRRSRFMNNRQTSASSGGSINQPFSSDVVSNSSISFIEVLSVITLQIHTLKQCSDLYYSQPYLDDENRNVSAGITVETYLQRLVYVPESLKDIWALRCHPFGPLPSKGSGDNRGSILGLLIALYEHWALSPLSKDQSLGTESLNGARYITTEGLKWLLRVVWSLSAYSDSIDDACEAATTGARSHIPTLLNVDKNSCRSTILSMLQNIDIWPQIKDETPDNHDQKTKSRDARLAAQKRILEKMKKKQDTFMAQMTDAEGSVMDDTKRPQDDKDLCIICRCDDTDGEHYSPLGYLGHVQRSRQCQMQSSADHSASGWSELYQYYVVVSEKGCQLREGKEMDSKPLPCLGKGSVVKVTQNVVTPNYGLAARRVFVRYEDLSGQIIEGWASTRSTRGYLILQPLNRLCYTNSRWGSTRPILRQCGHAAHSRCVEVHILSLHQKNATDHPYDGRFAANLNDGEFLCPLCKQLSNVLIPMDMSESHGDVSDSVVGRDAYTFYGQKLLYNCKIREALTSASSIQVSMDMAKTFSQFGSSILHAMQTSSWDNKNSSKKMNQNKWVASLRQWDYIESLERPSIGDSCIGDILPKMRQQLVGWATVGYTVSTAESSSRRSLDDCTGPTDPWRDYDEHCADNHPMLVELRRVIVAMSQLQRVLYHELETRFRAKSGAHIFGNMIANILDGDSIPLDGNKLLVTPSSHEDWRKFGPLLNSLPCHVARDGTLNYRYEARAVATSIWLMSPTNDDVPIPFNIRRSMSADDNPKDKIGTLLLDGKNDQPRQYFLPFVASAYLYVPLLCWDLDIFSGAIFSSLLISPCEISTLLEAARLLLIARLTQIVLTSVSMEEYTRDNIDEELSESVIGTDTPVEVKALIDFWNMCITKVHPDHVNVHLSDGKAKALYSMMSRAILPFARSTILLLRATVSALQLRLNKNATTKHRPISILEQEELMFSEDGLWLLKELGVPSLNDITCTVDSEWLALINKWIQSAVVYDSYERSNQFVRKVNPAGSNDFGMLKESGNVIPSSTPIGEGSDRMIDYGESVDHDEDLAMEEDSIPISWSDDEDMEDAVFDPFDQVEANDAEQSPDDEPDDTSDYYSANASDDNISLGVIPSLTPESVSLSLKYADVSRSSIIPYQPSFLGNGVINPGPRGHHFDYEIAAPLMRDLSHLGLIHNPGPRSNLITLPHSFIELYGLVNEIRNSLWLGSLHDTLDEPAGFTDTAVCLLTGEVITCGRPDRPNSYSDRSLKQRPGNCTLFARRVGSGTGVFFLVQKGVVLLIHNNKSVYYPSLYVDENGEDDYGLQRGRPLFLSEDRYRALEALWRNHGIPREVARIRSTADRILRDNWY